MRIESLELRARIVVQGFLSGLHRSPYHGFSVEFTEYRQYSPGDDLRHLDWRLFARSDRYYIKRFEDETNLRCTLLVDMSRSMGFGSIPYTKIEYARTMAATLAYFLSMQRDAVGLVTFDQEIADFVPPRYRPGHLHRLMVCLERAVSGTSTDLSGPLEQVAATVRKRGMVVLISDLLAPVEMLRSRLGYLRSQGHEVVLLRVLDPAELNFTFQKATTFVDVETGKGSPYIDQRSGKGGIPTEFHRRTCAVRYRASLRRIRHRHVQHGYVRAAGDEFVQRAAGAAQCRPAYRPRGRQGKGIVMGFLAPFYIAGLLAIGLPVLFHLLRRSPHGKQFFSSLMFLQQSPPPGPARGAANSTTFSCCCCGRWRSRCWRLPSPGLSFSGAATSTPTRRPGGASRCSWTPAPACSAAICGRRRWPRRRKCWKKSRPMMKLHSIAFDSQVRPLFTFDEWNQTQPSGRIAALNARLARVKPTWSGHQDGRRGAVAVADVLADTGNGGKAGGPPVDMLRRQIVLITDLQQGGHAETLQGHPWPDVPVDVRRVEPKQVSNASVQWVKQTEPENSAATQPAGTDVIGPPPLRVRVSNEPDSKVEQFTLTWENAKVKITGEDPLKVYVPAGRSMIVRVPWPRGRSGGGSPGTGRRRL